MAISIKTFCLRLWLLAKPWKTGCLVPYNVFEIVTKITKEGAALALGEYIGTREKLTRKQFWNTLDENVEYSAKQLDNDVVNVNQIRLIVKAVKESNWTLPCSIGLARIGKSFETPKMLVFAKSDSHADDIIQIIRDEFAEGNQFCKKITYRSEEDPKSVFSGSSAPGTTPAWRLHLDMIATGTDMDRPPEVHSCLSAT